jgi:hypothetical protein
VIDAQRQLSRLGIKFTVDAVTGERLFVIAHQSTVLAELLRGTMWAGLPGRGSPWSRILARVPGASSTTCGVRFGSGVSRATQFSLGYVLRGAVGLDPEAEIVRWESWAREQEAASA